MTEHEDQYGWDNATTSGLLDEYIGTITGAEFGVDIDYNSDMIRAMFDIQIVSHEDPGSEKQPGDTLEEAFNVGDTSTWEIVENGAKVVKVDGKSPRFHQNSGYGAIVKAANPKSSEPMLGADKLAAVLGQRGRPNEAKVWEGLTFRFKRIDHSFTNKEGEKINYQKVEPVEFVGVSGEETVTGSAATTTTAAAEPAAIDRDEVVALAAKHDEFSSFLADAMSTFPGIEKSELSGEVMDEGNGIFAEAHASADA